MKERRAVTVVLLVICTFSFGAMYLARAAERPRTRQASGAAPVADIRVYVSDFDVDVVPDKETTSAPPAPATRSSRGAAAPRKEDTPSEQANALVKGMSESLVKAFEKAGYQVERLRPGQERPVTGMLIRGVFAESDEENRIRRLLVGGVPVTPQMLAFVGVANLARPEQPFYGLANPPFPDPRHGPVITVTPYAPAARYELDRKPSEEALKKMAAEVVASFTELVNANPLAVTP